MQNFLKKLGVIFLEIIQTLVLALSLFVISYLYFFQTQTVSGTSMMPNFNNSDFLIAEKVSYRMGIPKRGDAVVIIPPSSEPCTEYGCQYIKRVIGLPGEKIKVAGGKVYINNLVLLENYLPKGAITGPGYFLREGREFILSDNQYLVMGDNRPDSHDGRDFGPINRSSIIGKILK